jgi:choline dehydrogenase-like flavoprotein
MAGCRQQSDEVLSYVYNDNMAFGKADTSYAGKFEVMWRGMSSNYALWDYEYEQGLDWDKVYDEYYPKFKALDEQQNPVTNKQLKALLDEVVEPLHDGHLAIQMKNH